MTSARRAPAGSSPPPADTAAVPATDGANERDFVTDWQRFIEDLDREPRQERDPEWHPREQLRARTGRR
jgi:hypothetical protein